MSVEANFSQNNSPAAERIYSIVGNQFPNATEAVSRTMGQPESLRAKLITKSAIFLGKTALEKVGFGEFAPHIAPTIGRVYDFIGSQPPRSEQPPEETPDQTLAS
jgi:hypothetical protein